MAIFGGEGCRDARDEVIAAGGKLKAPVGYSFRGKQWLEHDNPYAVGMTGLLGYGGAYRAIHDADLLLLLGTDFPFSEFLPGNGVKKVQIDRNPKHIGRRTPVDLGLVGDVKTTLAAVAAEGEPTRSETTFSGQAPRGDARVRRAAESLCRERAGHQADPSGISGRDAERTGCGRRDVFRRYGDRVHLARKAHQGRDESQDLRVVFLGVDGQCRAQCVWRAIGIPGPADDCALRRRRIHDARARRSANAGSERRPAWFRSSSTTNRSTSSISSSRRPAWFRLAWNSRIRILRDVAEAMGAKGIRLEEPGDVKEAIAEALAYKDGPVVVDAVVDPFALSLPAHVPVPHGEGLYLEPGQAGAFRPLRLSD